jgi:hypothetical protein
MIGPLNADLKLGQAFLKLIDDDAERVVTAADGKWLRRGTPWAYIDIWELGPIALNSIEWFEFPECAEYERAKPPGTGRLPPKRLAQNLDGAEAALAKLGKYPTERTARGLRIIGHVRR